MAWLLQFIEDWQQSSTFHEECKDEFNQTRLISEVSTQPRVCVCTEAMKLALRSLTS